MAGKGVWGSVVWVVREGKVGWEIGGAWVVVVVVVDGEGCDGILGLRLRRSG